MQAAYHGINNVQRIVPNLFKWTRADNQDYKNLTEIDNGVVGQFAWPVGHIEKNIPGIYLFLNSNKKDSLDFLRKKLFATPSWLINENISSRIGINAID